MRVAITGSRSITDKDWVNYHLDTLYGANSTNKPKRLVILSGGAKGVDTFAQEWARGEKLDFILFKPYHLIDSQVSYEPRFFFARNKQIVDNCDEMVAFWDGQSSGTRHAIEYAQKSNKRVTVISPPDH